MKYNNRSASRPGKYSDSQLPLFEGILDSGQESVCQLAKPLAENLPSQLHSPTD